MISFYSLSGLSSSSYSDKHLQIYEMKYVTKDTKERCDREGA